MFFQRTELEPLVQTKCGYFFWKCLRASPQKYPQQIARCCDVIDCLLKLLPQTMTVQKEKPKQHAVLC